MGKYTLTVVFEADDDEDAKEQQAAAMADSFGSIYVETLTDEAGRQI